jgi:hypothetical protein
MCLVCGGRGRPRNLEASTMTEAQKPPKKRSSRGARRFGYGVSIIVQVAMLVVVNTILTWDWSFMSWLTDDFSDLLPYINLSLVASIIVNVICMAYDPLWFKSFTQVILAIISFIVAIQTWRIFPFDFSETAFDATILVRFGLVFIMFAIGASIIAETVKMVRELSRTEPQTPPPTPAT